MHPCVSRIALCLGVASLPQESKKSLDFRIVCRRNSQHLELPEFLTVILTAGSSSQLAMLEQIRWFICQAMRNLMSGALSFVRRNPSSACSPSHRDGVNRL